MNLSRGTKISQAITVAAGGAGTTTINGSTLDMQGFESVLILVTFGEIVSGASTAIKAQQGNAANMSDAEDLAGTGQVIADTDDGKTFYIDIVNPTKRYLRLVVTRGTQNATVAEALYIQYDPKELPVAHGANVAGELHVSPVAGTP